MEPLEVAIRTLFTPAITGRTPPNNIECRLFALPAQHGLGIVSPSSLSDEYNWSQKVSAPLVSLILAQSFNYPPESYNDQLDLNKEIKKFSRGQWKLLLDQLKADLSSELLYSTQLAEEKGASNWLTSLPIQEHGFSLHKAAFRDALALRYGWRPNNLPSECICGKSPLWIMLSLVAVVGFPCSATMSSEILLPHFSLRSARTWLWSPHFRNWVEKSCQELPPTKKMVPGWTSSLMGFGVWVEKESTLMLGFLTHMPSLTGNPLSQPPTELTREKRRGNIYSASVTWNTALFPHLCSPLPVEWPRKHLFFLQTLGLTPLWVARTNIQYHHGLAKVCLVLFFAAILYLMLPRTSISRRKTHQSKPPFTCWRHQGWELLDSSGLISSILSFFSSDSSCFFFHHSRYITFQCSVILEIKIVHYGEVSTLP